MGEQFTGLVEITPEPNDDAKLRLTNADGGQALLAQNGLLWLGGNGSAGRLLVHDSGVMQTVDVDGAGARISVGAAGQAGLVVVESSNREESIRLDGDAGVTVGGGGAVGLVSVTNQSGPTIVLQGQDGNLVLGGNGADGDLVLQNAAGQNTITLDGQEANLVLGGNGADGDLVLRNTAGQNTITMDGDRGDLTVAGDVYLTGGDVAELFAATADPVAVTPGTVVVLDDDGRIAASALPYDARVAGVVSGAGDRVPALILDRQLGGGASATPRPVAVVGKVWCNADATGAPIRVGDLLTTSGTPGHAMRATDRVAAFGAVIGKALTGLPSGRGRVLVLVGLG